MRTMTLSRNRPNKKSSARRWSGAIKASKVRAVFHPPPMATWGGNTTGDMYVPPIAPMLLRVNVGSAMSASDRLPSVAWYCVGSPRKKVSEK